ncbi:hypothetical protein PO124_15015 [Bacillus licheniformis]|nr:hypothetical protein [Bacillus licheniformis]
MASRFDDCALLPGAVIAALAEPEHPFVVIWIPIVIIIGIIAVAGTRFHGKSEG